MLRISRRLIILISIFILTGCSAEYKMTINDTKDINEYLKVYESDSSKYDTKEELLHNTTRKEYLEANLKWPLAVYEEDSNPLEPKKISGVDYYNQSELVNNLGINYSFKHDFDMFKDSRLLNKCYSYSITSDKNIISFKTTSSFKCFDEYPLLDDVTFKLNTKCSIKENNSDENKNNELIYKITKNNINKEISFTIDCNPKKEKSTSLISFELVSIYIIGVGLIVLISRIIYKNNNKI